MNIPNLDQFTRNKIIGREQSLFKADIEANEQALFEELHNSSVLVIGGAGTIGASFLKAILNYKPAKVIVVDTNENGLTELTRDLRSTADQFIPTEFVTYPMSMGSRVFDKLYAEHAPFDIIANFAAHKHVRSEKDQYSIEAMLENNVLAAKRFLEMVEVQAPKHFFCVSTDKAANPVNVMGASKKLMEEVIMCFSEQIPTTTARFANVAFSNGSLLDGYVQRLLKQQPISCPADIRRFFVSPQESGEICMLACVLGNSGDIYFPKLNETELISFKDVTEAFFKEMGRDVKLCESEDEARQIAQSLTVDSPYPVYYFSSDTSGEKPYEEFFTPTDKVDMDRFASLGVITNARKPSRASIDDCLKELQQVLRRDSYDKAAIVRTLQSILPDFQHKETGRSLDSKM